MSIRLLRFPWYELHRKGWGSQTFICEKQWRENREQGSLFKDQNVFVLGICFSQPQCKVVSLRPKKHTCRKRLNNAVGSINMRDHHLSEIQISCHAGRSGEDIEGLRWGIFIPTKKKPDGLLWHHLVHVRRNQLRRFAYTDGRASQINHEMDNSRHQPGWNFSNDPKLEAGSGSKWWHRRIRGIRRTQGGNGRIGAGKGKSRRLTN